MQIAKIKKNNSKIIKINDEDNDIDDEETGDVNDDFVTMVR